MKSFISKNIPIIIIGILFFVFGFVSWLNAILIPYFKLVCELSFQQAMLVALVFYISYFIMAIPSSYILRMTGFKNGMMTGLLIMAAGSLLFIPAATFRIYWVFLTGLFIQATGLTVLQTAANPYITILGPLESAATRISVMGVANKLAGAIAPLIFLSAITSNPDEIDLLQKTLPTMSEIQKIAMLDGLSHRLIVPYVLMALSLIILSVIIRYSGLPDLHEDAPTNAHEQNEKKSILEFPHLILGVIAIFSAVSVEVLAVDTVINYGQYHHMSFRDAKYLATYTLTAMIISYVIGVMAVPKLFSQRKALKISAILGILLSLIVVGSIGTLSAWCIVLLGLCNALLWPSIWPLALDGLGSFTKQGSALLIMAVIGGAITPYLYGLLADHFTPQWAYCILLPYYFFLLYFSTHGYKAGKKSL